MIAYSVDVLNADFIMCYKVSHGLVDSESSNLSKRYMYPLTPGNLFKFAKLPVVSERDKNFLVIVLSIYGNCHLTICLIYFVFIVFINL